MDRRESADCTMGTFINPLWITALSLQIAILVVLGPLSFFLRASDCHTVVHNDSSLSVLLSSAIEEKAWPERRKTSLQDGSLFLKAREASYAFLVTADI